MVALRAFVRAYPGQSLAVLGFQLLAGVLEGLSLTALLPVLALAVNEPGAGAPGDDIGRFVSGALERLGATPTLGVLISVVVAGLAARSLLVLLARRHVGYTFARVMTDLRLRLLRAVLAARLEYFLRQKAGALANAASQEADTAARAYTHGAMAAALSIQLAVYVGVALLLAWQATLVYLGAVAVLALVLHRLVRATRKAGRKHMKQLRFLLAELSDSFQSVKALKAMARERPAVEILAARAERVNTALRRQVLSKEALRAAQQPAFALLVGAGAYGALVFWQLPASRVMVLLVLLVRVLQTVGKVQSQYQAVAGCEPAFVLLERTIRDAERAAEAPSGSRPPALERGIRLEGVHFAYDRSAVLRDVSMEIPAGELVMLIGFSGSGKTTLLDLVAGLIRPQDGVVRVDGVPLPELDQRAWRRMIGYVPQETLLLHDTVLRNVTLGEPDLAPGDAERALRDAGAWEFVSALPDGIETVVGERGARLSIGQRQRVALARALAHRPRLLILDEATSALDPETERALWDTLERLRGGMTLLAITHRLGLVERADRVYRLEKGRAVPGARPARSRRAGEAGEAGGAPPPAAGGA